MKRVQVLEDIYKKIASSPSMIRSPTCFTSRYHDISSDHHRELLATAMSLWEGGGGATRKLLVVLERCLRAGGPTGWLFRRYV